MGSNAQRKVELEQLRTENAELRAEIERLKQRPAKAVPAKK